ncbi:MAG: membrane-bound lytic murein transglycosylase MltF [Rhodocyclales bacterium]|nr:membrane-bound lytic murein transglycosylase MltF [Rhodocyclales bacterium]
MRPLLCVILLSLLAACGERPLPPYSELGKLVVVTREGPTTYQVDGNGKASGFEHDLAELFAQDLGVEARFVAARDHAEIATMLVEGRAHLAAAALAPSTNGALRFTQPIRELRQLLVQHEDALPVEEVADLAERTVMVLAGSTQRAALDTLQPRPAGLRIVELEGTGEMSLLERVSENAAALAVIDSAHFGIGANFFPALQPVLELAGTHPLVWAFPAGADEDFQQRAEAFIARIKRDGTLARLNDRYFGHVQRLNQQDVVQFLERMSTALPHYRREFVAAQDIHGIDWRLLAALAYQESHWRPDATSPTGVRGMMMLTADTADRLRVTNRLDARQSILAGARYFGELREQLPAQVKEPDRTWLALAAYNLGMGHMNGARAVAQMVKRDPDSWYEMKKVLPLLARPEYAARLKSGAARGGEAVIMVENIRTYYDILARYEKPATSPQALSIRSSPPM